MPGIVPNDSDIMVNKKDLVPPAKELTPGFGLQFSCFSCKTHSDSPGWCSHYAYYNYGFLENRYN